MLRIIEDQDKSDAEDICQEVLIKALQRARTGVLQEKAWLMRIAVNLCKKSSGTENERHAQRNPVIPSFGNSS